MNGLRHAPLRVPRTETYVPCHKPIVVSGERIRPTCVRIVYVPRFLPVELDLFFKAARSDRSTTQYVDPTYNPMKSSPIGIAERREHVIRSTVLKSNSPGTEKHSVVTGADIIRRIPRWRLPTGQHGLRNMRGRKNDAEKRTTESVERRMSPIRGGYSRFTAMFR